MMLIQKDLEGAVMACFKVITHYPPGGAKEIRKTGYLSIQPRFIKDMRSSEALDVPPKRRLTFNGKHGVISRKIELLRTRPEQKAEIFFSIV
jgi:hypothetical protein